MKSKFFQLNTIKSLSGILLLAVLTLVAGTAQATSPTEFDVDGNTITFNSHDWFQVQDDTNYATFCEGFLPCHVPAGNYIVINHYTGDRFHVTIDTQETMGGGQIITWPNDGWYQIQNAVTLATICEGGTTCLVHPGSYYVINLTTGHRSTIVVRGEVPAYSDFVVDGNTVTFTKRNWFQIQDQSSYAPVCEGFAPCHVPDGNYQVINFATGQIWMNVQVAGH